MERILIIEDERDVNGLLAQTLQEDGYETKSAYNGMEGIKFLREGSFDMVLLDLMLPFKSGDEVLREIRKNSDIPVIIISAKDMVRTKIDLLTIGADDYITKPFDLGEVSARVASNLRRYHQADSKKQIVYKELHMDTEAKSVTVEGVVLELTSKEYQLFELFLKFPNKVFSKANLYETIWGEEYLGDDNVIKTHISNLRNKIKKANSKIEYIETVWGLGYRLAK
ncbi:MAG: response regulator transcription factor [Lachnospiraceae bacterium]|nr:response regulator transcription factor [Lachnospiraceae bacterium]